ncbi:MAG TPA: hypothetical protein VKZ79_19350 [Alphaproteobacteria bacterium]|nr:hypothetical protein [Alphaproteobacteria bacterium]
MRIGCSLALLLAAAPVAFAEPSVPVGITLHDMGDGWSFGDAKGMALYIKDLDKEPGKSACTGQCAIEWPPAIATADAKPQGDWSVIARDDGGRQWAFRGKPLYTYLGDRAPGEVGGDGLGYFVMLTHVLFRQMPLPPGLSIHATEKGRVIADAKGMTLYSFDKGVECTGGCLVNWTPVAAPAIAQAWGDWTPVARPDGSRQWAYKGHPLYAFARDANPGDLGGDDPAQGWRAAIVRPAPGVPAGFTEQTTDVGRVVADAQGRTIYTMTESPMRPKFCDEECLKAEWRPVVASTDAHPLPGWSIVHTAGGPAQWAYKGKPLFTFVQDRAPGDIRGDRFGNMASGGLAPFEPLQLPL